MERIKLNLIPSGVAPIVHLSQYDDGRKFGIDLFEGESVYVLDGTETLTVNSRKPDGHVVVITVTNTGTSSLDVDTVEQLTAVHGVSYAKLQIVKGSVTIATLPFLIDVSRDPLENGDPSESFIQNLRTQIAEGVAEEVATQYDSANVIFDTEPTDNHGIGYTVTSEGIKTAIDNAFDYDNTASGSLVHITDGADNIPVKSLVSQIVAVQDLHGYDKPWVGGAGKNKLEDTFNTSTLLGVVITADNGVIELNGTGTGSNSFAIKSRNTSGNYIYIPKGNYIFSAQGIGSGIVVGTTYNGAFYEIARNDSGESVAFSITDNTPSDYKQSDGSVLLALYITISVMTYNHQKVYPMIRLASEPDATFEPYENICPITGFDSGVITVTDNDQVTNTYTFAFGQTVYGGYFDNKGNLVVTHSFIASYNGETINEPWISSMDNYVPNTLPSIGAQVKYPLTTPITLSITSQDIPTLLGENNIYSNCGDVEVEYYTNKSNDILEFVDSEIGKKNGTNIPIEENSQDSIKDYIDSGLSGKQDTLTTTTGTCTRNATNTRSGNINYSKYGRVVTVGGYFTTKNTWSNTPTAVFELPYKSAINLNPTAQTGIGGDNNKTTYLTVSNDLFSVRLDNSVEDSQLLRFCFSYITND
jgi:hypothetical protein